MSRSFSVLFLVLVAKNFVFGQHSNSSSVFTQVGGRLVTTCPPTGVACSSGGDCCGSKGDTNSVTRALTYDVGSGVFNGTLTSNGCPATIGADAPPNPSSTCVQFSFPYFHGDVVTPFGGPIAVTLAGGYIYNGQEAGFSHAEEPTLCDGAPLAYCAGGMAIPICLEALNYTCSTSGGAAAAAALATSVAGGMFAGDAACGFHASPWHAHSDPLCEYDHAGLGHSPLIGLAFDGLGIYGLHEADGEEPTDLNACNWHVGRVPGTAQSGGADLQPNDVAVGFGAGSGAVPHYHVSSGWPFTLGCYGNMSFDDCLAASPATCNTWVPTYTPEGETMYVDDWCTCRRADGQLPATAAGVLPTVAGALCYSTYTGNAMAPSSPSGTVPCSNCSTCPGVVVVPPAAPPPGLNKAALAGGLGGGLGSALVLGGGVLAWRGRRRLVHKIGATQPAGDATEPLLPTSTATEHGVNVKADLAP
jgi:hypothetical protein